MKKVKIWDKTSIIWEFSNSLSGDGGNTNIPVDDWHEKHKQYFHSLRDLRITPVYDDSLHEREGLIELEIFRVAICPTTARNKIIELLKDLDRGVIEVKTSSHSSLFSVRYRLGKGESFCDSAIDRAKLLLKLLGVESGQISNFIIFRESLVKTKSGWIPFADHLREKHGIKQMCSLWGNKITLGKLVFSINYKDAESNWLECMNA